MKYPRIPAVLSLLTLLLPCGALICQAPAQGPRPAAKVNEWKDYVRTWAVSDTPRDGTGRPLPPGPSLMPEAIKELPPGDLSNPWKMTDGTMRQFACVSWVYRFTEVGKPVRLSLTIKGPPGGETQYMPVSALHPDEYPRVQRIMWFRYYENLNRNFVPPQRPPAPAAERTVFHFSGSGLQVMEKSGFANRPPGPLVAEAAVADLPVWPAVEKWKLKDGREVQFSLFGWHWRASSSPEADLDVLPAGAAVCTVLPALDLDAAERDRLLRTLWRRHYRVRTLAKYPDPWNRGQNFHDRERVNSLTNRDFVSVLVPVPSLPLPGCRLMPPPAAIRPRSEVSDAGKAPPGTFERERLSDCMAAWLLWWDKSAWLPLGKNGDDKEKRQWLLTEMSRGIKARNNEMIRWGHIMDWLREFSIKQLGGQYDFQLFRDLDYSPANQARLAAGLNGTVVRCMIYSGDRVHCSCSMPLIAAGTDGSATLTLCGMQLDGKWTPCDRPRQKRREPDSAFPPVYEFVIDKTIALPKEFKQKNLRIILGSDSWTDAIEFIVPQRCETPLKANGKEKR